MDLNLELGLHLRSPVDQEGRKKRAFLVSPYRQGETDAEALANEYLSELCQLVDTFGVEIVARETAALRKVEAATYLTTGKLQELVDKAKRYKAEMIIIDAEITPNQQKRLEEVFGLPVLDRTEVILEIFASRAKTKEARLQVELAKVRYHAPRLKRMWTHLSRQGKGGGGAYLKGEGEKQIEIDRRLLKKKISDLQKEINEVRAYRKTQRNKRERTNIPTFAIVGYTNAGKSTLLNAFTEAGVYVEDKLFATLDTTTRKITLKDSQEVLLTDTVGFIRKLPHQLIAAFKSTLEEALFADILIHVVDASHPFYEHHAKTTLEVLKELGVEDTPILTVGNKADLLKDRAALFRLRLLYPRTVEISAKQKQGMEDLEEAMMEALRERRQTLTLRIPQSQFHMVAEAIREGHLLHQSYEDNDVILQVDMPALRAIRFKPYLV